MLERPKVVRKSIRKLSTPSIKSALSAKSKNTNEGETEKKVEQKLEPKLKDPFNQAKLDEVWPIFRDKFKDEVYLFNAFSIAPKHIEENIILFEVDNSVMNDQYRKYMPELIGFFRRHLNNDIFDIQMKIVKKQRKATALTDEQKLQEMIKKNANLALMKSKFNLDFNS